MSAYRKREVTTSDGQSIVGRFYGTQQEPQGAALIVPAMGVQQTFYDPLATWLASQGFLTATFDYRGVGLSRRAPLRGFRADILDWARLDCGAMIQAVSAEAAGKPLYWIGHSLGGQILPFVPHLDRVTKAFTIAAGSGYWRENASPLNYWAWWLWYVAVPVTMPLFGYFPGKKLRKVGDLPRGVMEQWRRWCTNREYAVGAEGKDARARYAAVRTPIVSLSFTDDEFMSLRNTESIHSFYVNAPKKMKRIAPQDVGAKRIGHFGFFRAASEIPLWRGHLLPELQPETS
jgi:predicted alpha/beta hydrolase